MLRDLIPTLRAREVGVRRRAMSRVAKRWQLEPLEARQLLSGVTLITHGLGGGVDDWITKMADAIVARPDLQIEQPRYRVDVTDTGHDGGPLSVVNSARTGPKPADCPNSAEIVVLLNWSDVAGSLTFGGGYHRSTRDVAAAVAEQLVAPNFLQDFPYALAQLPFHLIGHSRGASLVGELARRLGERGIWVDQVTTLDPHPVDGIREPTLLNYDFGDAPMTSWENVVFWDNYWRTEGAGSFDFTGEKIANVADLQLSEAVLSNGGYAFEHSDTHLWYHGTIDLSASANDGGASVPASWFGGAHPLRDESGYAFSRLVGRPRPAAGVSSDFGGGAHRTALSWTMANWPNLLQLRLDAPPGQLLTGNPIPVSYYHQDVDGADTISWFLDPDRNPYNANEIARNQLSVEQTTAMPAPRSSTVDTQGVSPGSYYVAAKIHDAAGHQRYAYAARPATLISPPTFVVTNRLDSGPGSLRQAILDAQATPGLADVIKFALDPGEHNIELASALPPIIDPATIILPSEQSIAIGVSSRFSLSDFVQLDIKGGGSLTLGGELNVHSPSAVDVFTGALRLTGDFGAHVALAAHGSQAKLEFASSQHLSVLRLNDGGTAALAPGGGLRLVVGSLAIDGASRLDLADGTLIVQATSISRQEQWNHLVQLLTSGFAGGLWNGVGLASNTAAADQRHRTALGALINANALGEPIQATFSGEPCDASSLLVAHTYFGDANLSGDVDGTDYALIDNGFNFGLNAWQNGDFNFDGAVDGADYAIIDNAFHQQEGPLAADGPATSIFALDSLPFARTEPSISISSPRPHDCAFETSTQWDDPSADADMFSATADALAFAAVEPPRRVSFGRQFDFASEPAHDRCELEEALIKTLAWRRLAG